MCRANHHKRRRRCGSRERSMNSEVGSQGCGGGKSQVSKKVELESISMIQRSPETSKANLERAQAKNPIYSTRHIYKCLLHPTIEISYTGIRLGRRAHAHSPFTHRTTSNPRTSQERTSHNDIHQSKTTYHSNDPNKKPLLLILIYSTK